MIVRKAYGHSSTNGPWAWTLVEEKTLLVPDVFRIGPVERSRLAGYRVGAGPGVRLQAD